MTSSGSLDFARDDVRVRSACIRFAIAMAASFVKRLISLSAAKEFGTPLYLYSAGTILDHYQRLDRALGGLDHQILLCGQSQFQRRHPEITRECRRWFRHRFRRRTLSRDQSRRRSGQVHVCRGRKVAARNRVCAGKRIYCFNVESEAELEYINEIAPRKACGRRLRCGRIPTSIPARTNISRPARARTSSASR